MARNKLTSNKRSFRKNSRAFLNKITEAPIDITIDDGVNPPYTVTYSPNAGQVTNTEGSVPPGGGVVIERTFSDREVNEN